MKSVSARAFELWYALQSVTMSTAEAAKHAEQIAFVGVLSVLSG
jgi:hypothetical protein